MFYRKASVCVKADGDKRRRDRNVTLCITSWVYMICKYTILCIIMTKVTVIPKKIDGYWKTYMHDRTQVNMS